MSTVGNYIRAHRVGQGMPASQVVQEASVLLGRQMHQTGLTRIELGQQSLKFDEAVALSRVLQFGLEDLVENVGLDSDALLRRARLVQIERDVRELNAEAARIRALEANR